MSDSDEGQGKSLPSWQQKSTVKEPVSSSTSVSPNESSALVDTSRHTIIEQARKFLEDQNVRDATTDKKIEFLESKGLNSDEIRQLLGVSRNQEASKVEPAKQIETPKVQSTTPTPQTAVQVTRDIPPIITYPEFLTTPTQPAPLITARRLLTTLYLFGGLSAIFYGTSKYLVAPMVASLTRSRHSLAETTQTNLDRFLERLSDLVSEIPPTISRSNEIYKDVSESGSDSDPTELFSRDVGVQTSLPSSPQPSYPGTPGLYPFGKAVDSHVETMRRIKTCVDEANDAGHSEGRDLTDLTLSITVLRDYLDGLAYIPPTYGYNGFPSAVSDRKEEDEIARVKASIRGVKGVLLSARSFPGGRR